MIALQNNVSGAVDMTAYVRPNSTQSSMEKNIRFLSIVLLSYII
jgi:hypothetical protein